ncbi:MAG: HAD hydrolase family protein [Candidatus Bathyarchaeota archaeon]|nr:HAD hydrolase family protein [Candidatus Bathyarchaeota archaeon]MDH5779628.1 HAD hydrolase family protein [Candidatus Bathyarchaeota archaeon]
MASPQDPRRLFITDCEGPISRNDNAYELTEHFIPDGDKFFALISKYDDVQADVVKRRGYKAGDTLRLILPFFMAYEVTNKKMKRFSAQHILLVPGARDTLGFVRGLMPSFIVSTSYEQYMRALCEVVDFPYNAVRCTLLDIDRYRIDEKEAETLRRLRREIVAMPVIHIPSYATSIDDFSTGDKETIKRLDEIFWDEISGMKSGRILEEVNPIGGSEKASAVQRIARETGTDISETIYFGDSITDVQPFRLVNEHDGLTVSFNGNNYAVREAEIAVLSGHTIITSVFAEVFSRLGSEGVIELVEEWSYSALRRYCSPALQSRIVELYPKALPKVELITSNNRERLIEESSAFRKNVRGEAVGGLG